MRAERATFVFVALLSFAVEILAGDLIVRLKHGGRVKGSTLKSQQGRTIYAFRGIPYAEPPTGALRFKPPVPKLPWRGKPFDATKDGPICPQVDELFDSKFQGQEDCLYLNVYTTKIRKTNRKTPRNNNPMAVMVYFHGGGFQFGSSASTFFGPGLLLDSNVVLVTMNYRLGALGFLSTGDSVSPGNYGLMDQSLTLQWVKENIHVFGGDPKKVTIFGESAGGVSVGYHMLSKMSEGLFRAAIAQSGTPLCFWAVQKNPTQSVRTIAAEFKCPTENTSEIVECLRNISAKDLASSAHGGMFVPAVDGTFLAMAPEDIIASGNATKVPYLSGVNKDEGLVNYAFMYLRTDMSNIKKEVESRFNGFFGDEDTKLIMEKYFSKIDWTNKDATRQAIVQAFTDASFKMAHYKMMKLLAQNGFTTYAYSLDYVSSVGLINVLGIDKKWGVSHTDDLPLLFDGPTSWLKNATADDKKIMKMLSFLWTNFAKYGNPTRFTRSDVPLKWKTSNDSEMNVYHIDNPIRTTTYNPEKDDLYHFWTELFEENKFVSNGLLSSM